MVKLAENLHKLGFKLFATKGTAKVIQEAGFECESVNKVREGRPHIVDKIKNDEISFIVNTTNSKPSRSDSFTIRRSALQNKTCYYTTLAGAQAAVLAMNYGDDMKVRKL